MFLNVGDSRAIISKKQGTELQICTYDHKPHFFGEKKRIFENGGLLYRVSSHKMTQETEIYYANNEQEFLHLDPLPERSPNKIFGPWRVKPGGLSVQLMSNL